MWLKHTLRDYADNTLDPDGNMSDEELDKLLKMTFKIHNLNYNDRYSADGIDCNPFYHTMDKLFNNWIFS